MVGPQGPKVIVVQNLLHHSLSSSGPCWLTGKSCWKVTPGKTEGSWSGVLIRIVPQVGWGGGTESPREPWRVEKSLTFF